MPAYVTRFAPSPTGVLHLGHAASAAAVWVAAGAEGGKVLLRIEDIDQTRCRSEYEAAIHEDLRWLGFEWTEPVRRQSEHFADYRRALENLRERGLIYACFRTRKEVLAEIGRAPHEAVAAFTGARLPENEEADKMGAGEPFAWRLSLAVAREILGQDWERLAYSELAGGHVETVPVRPELHGDVILGRKDTPASYHLACTHDDALQGVTHIVRGDDLAASTHVHVLLQVLMGWPHPVYTHHRLLVDASGKRFAKRDRSMTLRAMREAGETAMAVRRRAESL